MEVDSDQPRPVKMIKEALWDGIGLDGMIIIGHGYYKSTFGASNFLVTKKIIHQVTESHKKIVPTLAAKEVSGNLMRIKDILQYH